MGRGPGDHLTAAGASINPDFAAYRAGRTTHQELLINAVGGRVLRLSNYQGCNHGVAHGVVGRWQKGC